MDFIKIPLKGCTIYLTNGEINKLLIMQPEVFKKGIERGKAFLRQERFEKPRNPREGQI
jgi:hypothetical protein